MNEQKAKATFLINKEKYEAETIFDNLVKSIAKIDEGNLDRSEVIDLLQELKNHIDDSYKLLNGVNDKYFELASRIERLKNKMVKKVES